MSTPSLSTKLQFASKLGMGHAQCAYLENILMDSFLNVYAEQRTMHSGRNLAAPIQTLNDLSANLSPIDLISKMGQKEEDKAFQSMEKLFAPLQMTLCQDSSTEIDQVSECLKFTSPILSETIENKIVKQDESDNVSKTNEENTITSNIAKDYTPSKKDFDSNHFVHDERRKLLNKLEHSTDDRIIFNKRTKKLRKNAKHDDESYRGSRFWGVSKNKSKWQVMITLNHIKEYNGGYPCEQIAARVYDKKSI